MVASFEATILRFRTVNWKFSLNEWGIEYGKCGYANIWTS